MEKLEVVTELRLRRETAAGPLRTRKNVVAELAPLCAAPTMMNEYRLLSWENREHVPYEVHACALRAYFGVDSVAKLGLGHTFEAAHHWTYATKQERKGEVHRRLLLAQGVNAALLGPALLPVGPLTALAQMLGGRRSLGMVEVVDAERVATHLASEYLANPGHETVRAAIAHARVLTDRVAKASMSSKARARLRAVASDASSLAGHTALDAGRRGEADRWFADALALAREAEDQRLEALAIASTAWTVSESTMPGYGDRTASLRALRAAASLDGHLPPAGRAWVNGHLSRELAAAHDDSSSRRALERALHAARLAGRSEPGWGFWSQHGEFSGWDGIRATVFTALQPLNLGRYGDAVPLLEDALDGTVTPIRRATLHLDLTRAGVGLDEPERARAEALAALDQADAHGLAITVTDIRVVRATFPPHWPTWATEELDERLATS